MSTDISEVAEISSVISHCVDPLQLYTVEQIHNYFMAFRLNRNYMFCCGSLFISLPVFAA